jgi:Ca2+/Na+ antiporter
MFRDITLVSGSNSIVGIRKLRHEPFSKRPNSIHGIQMLVPIFFTGLIPGFVFVMMVVMMVMMMVVVVVVVVFVRRFVNIGQTTEVS